MSFGRLRQTEQNGIQTPDRSKIAEIAFISGHKPLIPAARRACLMPTFMFD